MNMQSNFLKNVLKIILLLAAIVWLLINTEDSIYKDKPKSKFQGRKKSPSKKNILVSKPEKKVKPSILSQGKSCNWVCS